MSCKEEFQPHHFGLGHNEPRSFAQSHCRCPHELFIVWRVFWALWHTAWLIRSIQLNEVQTEVEGDGAKWLIFLTNWSYFMLFAQSWIHAIIVLYHTAKGEKETHQFADSTTWYHKLLWVFTSVSFDAAIVVTLLFWILVFKDLKYALTVVTHAVTSFYVLTDIFVQTTPWRLLHVIYPMVYALIYMLFSVVYHLAGGTNLDGKPYIYKALDWANTGQTTGMAVGTVLVAIPLTHLFMFALYKLRVFIREYCCGTTVAEPKVSDNPNSVEMA